MGNIKKQYGIWTGIAMVVGIVIGSGVFFKAGKVLKYAGGDLKVSLLAWTVGGLIMISSAFAFAIFATKVEKFNGVVDYVERSTNKRVGYHLAWIFTTLYYPIIAAIVSLIAGSYFFSLIGVSWGMASWQNLLFAFLVLTGCVFLNYYTPIISAKFQVSATFIKLIPIVVIAIVGLFASLIIGSDVGIVNALTKSGVAEDGTAYVKNFGEAVKCTSFAYEGWVCATAINAELKDSKKNLPKALVGGTIAILVFYLIYYLSLSAILGNSQNIIADDNAPLVAFSKILGNFGSKLFVAFIVVSCLGTVNGVTISCCRGMYTMSCRGLGIAPEKCNKLNEKSGTSFWSCMIGYFCMILFLVIWFLAINGKPIFKYLGSMDEIVCAIIYAVYITMYIYIIKNYKELNPFFRFVVPVIAIIGSLFFTLCGTGLYQLIFNKSTDSLICALVFFGLTAILLIPSFFFYNKDAKEIDFEEASAEESASEAPAQEVPAE